MIEVENLSKQFGSIRAVDNLSFRVEKGEILGFLGPNGAGKSTTMKMITCFLAPSEGVVKVGGYSTEESPEEVKKLIGYLPETSASYADMNVTEFLEFIAEVRVIEVMRLPLELKMLSKNVFSIQLDIKP